MEQQDGAGGGLEDSQEEEAEAEAEAQMPAALSFSQFSSSLRAMVRIRNKYLAIKKRRVELGATPSSLSAVLPRSTSPKIFTFDGAAMAAALERRKKKKKKRRRVMFPNDSRRRTAPKESSRAKNCLVFLTFIVFLQVYNAIENLDDHLLRYDLEGLDKTVKREVFGQREASEGLLVHLGDYLSTYVHNRPLVLSLHGPSGVGKSHLGRILGRHFRSVLGEELVLQYFALHHCPLEGEAQNCARELSLSVAQTLKLAEEEEKIPFFIFDEVEFMHRPLLDTVYNLTRPGRSAEFLNAVYVLIGSLGNAEITKFVLQNSSSDAAQLGRDVGPVLRDVLEKRHPLWGEPETELLPLTLLEKGHVMDCFLDEMTREGFYPDRGHIERLAAEISYYAVDQRLLSHTGCKQVVAKVNLL
ncbi:torsin-4A isoform X2 [Conger conger]|nr:torsin-4A isoform X2 [Conger conger]